jgi:hypothetical protein
LLVISTVLHTQIEPVINPFYCCGINRNKGKIHLKETNIAMVSEQQGSFSY